jgi:hypothetical protein
MEVSENLIIGALIGLVSFLLGVTGYLINRWISDVTTELVGIKDEQEESKLMQYKNHAEIKKELSDLKIASTKDLSELKIISQNTNKEVQRLEKLSEVVDDNSKKLIYLENKVEAFGKIIYIDRSKRDK